MGGLARRLYRSRTAKLALLGSLLLTCVAGVVGYCFAGLVSVEDRDIASASIVSHEVDGTFDPGAVYFPVPLTDTSARTELAQLMNGLRRWPGGRAEGMPRVYLEMTLVDGREYTVVWWWDTDDLELVIAGDEAGGDARRLWVRSAEMRRFLIRYLDRG